MPSVHGGAQTQAQEEAFEAARHRLAANLRASREAAGLTQEALASKVGIDTRHVVRLERGAAGNPSLRLLAGLASALAIDLTSLLKDAPRPNPRPRGRPKGSTKKSG